MSTLLLSVFIVALIFILIFRIATRTVYGRLIRDKDLLNILKRNIERGVHVNRFDASIIDFGELPFISTIPFDILGYYYMSGIGVIPRWSKSHKLIKAEFEKVRNNIYNK